MSERMWRRRAGTIALGTGLAVVLLAGVAIAGVTWDPADTARTSNRPRTCNTPVSTCTDSAFTITSASPSFAVSNHGTTHYQHAVWFSDHFGDSSGGYADYTSTCSPDCAGVYYARSSDGGTTWNGGTAGTDAVQISPTSITGQRATIATSGSHVYVAYVTTVGYWDKMCAKADRLLYVAVNSHYGAGAWTTVQLTTSGRVDFPSIAASGSDVYVAHTNSISRQVVVERSTNNGTSFETRGVGWTENTFDNKKSPGSPKCASPPSPSGLEGFDGAPQVAADGNLVAVGWVSSTAGRAKAKISLDGGNTWPGNGDGSPCTTGVGECSLHLASAGAIGPVSNNPSTNRGTVSVAASAGRATFAWKDTSGVGVPKGIYARQYLTVGSWGPPRLLSCLQTAAPCSAAPAALVYNDASSTAVAHFGTSGTGVSWSGCPYSPSSPTLPCNNKVGGSNADPGSEILFKESWNGGATWWAGVSGSYARIAANTVTDSEVNEFPTLAYDKPGSASLGCAMGTQGPEVGCVRSIYFMGRSKNFFDYAAYLSFGTQTP